MKKKILLEKIVFSEQIIISKIKEYAEKLNFKFKNQKLTVIIVLNGAVFFGIELVKNLKVKELEIDFLSISTYKEGIKKDKIQFDVNLKLSLKNKNVLIIEDIVHSGKTLKLIYEFFKKQDLNSLKICSLIRVEQEENLINGFEFDYLLTSQKERWIVGFGLDYDEKYRCLKDIHFINFEK